VNVPLFPDLFRPDEPLLFDAFCGVGAASRGYQLAGYRVIGVDIEPQPDYCGDHFVQGDAIEFIHKYGRFFSAGHASPPCQDRIAITAGNRQRPGWTDTHVNLVPATRAVLAEVRRSAGIPTVIECGVGRHLRRDLVLCGEMFGLDVLRHRWFEIDGPFAIPAPTHRPHRGKVRGWRHGAYYDGPYLAAYGAGGGKATVSEMQSAMRIDWTESHHSLTEAIPPAYTEYIGRRLMDMTAAPERRAA
jgi:hypothetical protein